LANAAVKAVAAGNGEEARRLFKETERVSHDVINSLDSLKCKIVALEHEKTHAKVG